MMPSQRHAFDMPDDVAYFNCSYMAPMLKAVRRAGEEAITRTAQPWSVSADDFFTPAERARGLFARLIHARPEDIAIIPAASYGISTAAKNLRIGKGQTILMMDEEFPSNVYPWHALAKRDGGEIRVARRPPDGDWTAALLDKIDDRVAIAALSHCHWTDGGYVDLERVSAALQKVGARLVLDVTQSLGVLPLDVTRIKVDYLSCAAYKWLLGPYSIGFLYAAEEHHRGDPLDYNWITRAEHFLGMRFRDGAPPGLLEQLRDSKIFVSIRGGILRVTPHLCTTPSDVDRLLGALQRRAG
jgi:selenocysteine lyase/cysteine desulfurase